MDLPDRVEQAVQAIRQVTATRPQVAIIPGTGLDGILDDIEREHEVPLAQIPGFPVPAATTHTPKLVFGRLGGKRVTEDGVLVIHARRFRSQDRNRRDAIDRLIALILEASIQPKSRLKTKPTKASKERRLEAKRRRSRTKHKRQYDPPLDE